VVSVSKAIVGVLRGEAVSYVFSLPGGHIQPIYDVIYDEDEVELISVRHEEAAAHMADGYARVKGRPGVCLGTAGPGATNMVTGVAEAYASSSPLIVLTGQVRTTELYKGAIQEFDTVAVFRHFTKWSCRAPSGGRVPELLRTAFRVALSGRYGPAHLDLPRDVLLEDVEFEDVTPQHYRPEGRVRGDRGKVEEAVELLLSAEKPVILAGGGVKWSQASSEVLELASLLGAPVLTTLTGKGVVPEDNPLVLGVAPAALLTESGWRLISGCDVMLAVGCRFSGISTVDWHLPVPRNLIHVDVDPCEIGKNYPVRVGIVGDAKAVLEEMITSIKGRRPPVDREKRLRELREVREEFWGELLKGAVKGGRVTPKALMDEVKAFLKGECVVVTDVGNNQLWSIKYIQAGEGVEFITPVGFGTVGFGFPASLGAKLAAPEKRVVCLTGDGGFAAMIQELETAVRHGINVVVVVMNNRGTAEIKQIQQVKHSERYIGVDYLDVDFSQVAKGFRAYGERVEKPGDVHGALERAFEAGKPAVVDVVFDDSGEISPWVLREALRREVAR